MVLNVAIYMTASVAVIWLRRTQLDDYECRSYMTTNVALMTTNVRPKFSNVPFFQITWRFWSFSDVPFSFEDLVFEGLVGIPKFLNVPFPGQHGNSECPDTSRFLGCPLLFEHHVFPALLGTPEIFEGPTFRGYHGNSECPDTYMAPAGDPAWPQVGQTRLPLGPNLAIIIVIAIIVVIVIVKDTFWTKLGWCLHRFSPMWLVFCWIW